MFDIKLNRYFTGPVVLILIIMTIMTGCNNKENYQIAIAEQYGLAYAPLQIIKKQRLLEKNLPEIEVTWRQMANTAAIREAMLAGKLDLGFMAIPPFLIGRDKGMNWKIISGLSACPLGLVTYREDLKNLQDFTVNDRIVLPQPGSIQHILLAMACERETGDARRLDDLLISMAHPDGMNALFSRKEISAHFTSPPYLFKELEQGDMYQILSGYDALGRDFTFIIGAATTLFHDNNPDVYKAFVRSLEEAIEFIRNNPREAADILAVGYNLSSDDVLRYITWPGMEYSMEVKGLEEFALFLKRTGYISRTYNNPGEIMWDVDYYER